MAARAGDLSTLELPALEIESTQVAPEAGGADASRLPEGLSLEELLEAAPQPPPGPGSAGETAPERAPAPIPLDGLVPESEPVFDLTADMQGPSLPLVEVGSGEPPALSVEDLLRPPGPTPLEAGAGEVPEVQHEPVVEPPSAQPGTPATSHGPADIGALVDAAAAAFPASAAPLMAEVLAPPAPAGEAESQGEQAPPVAGVALEMGSLRQAVTERVAHELAKELSGRLIERIEGIVWEVVPDLAEILINREIERIRAMAEGKQPS
jgi:hypothetical protein